MGGSEKLRVAVTGGGLAGAAIANALFRQPHLDVHIYESAPEFSERGQAIGLAVNAQRALARLLPDAEDVFQRAGAVPMHSTRILMGSGPAAGTKVIDLAEENPGKILHRAALLHELLAPMPPEIMHANKKLSAIEEHSNALVLQFEDGSTAETDALIGADGLFGSVRSHVLGADHPAVKPVAAGWAGAHNLVSYDTASNKLGRELFEEDRQYGWIGEGGLFMHDVLNDRKIVQCVGSSVDRNPSSERRRSIDRQYLEHAFSTWLDGPVAGNMIDLLLDQEKPAVFAQWEHSDAPSYVKENICIAGDAAHAMTPWQGSGAAMALEDAVVLGALFAQIHSRSQIAGAFRAYDAIRRPRTQHIAASSRLTGRIMTGLVEEIGTDPEKLHAALKDRWDYIYDFDLGKHVDEAVSMLQAAQ
ncbi:FAD/NAD(P)-binding domain-containing protein [Viridothelium virens]|uniref:FAD/NAD(P)-binding domain-containing protein n=1 Tax=Viridothelium virens TaxID=1048519 RepID=A0A6A6GT56_VIRVR|nr:FAD/NAD(P)-binding domain-containing protein [Viridothelium virens]